MLFIRMLCRSHSYIFGTRLRFGDDRITDQLQYSFGVVLFYDVLPMNQSKKYTGSNKGVHSNAFSSMMACSRLFCFCYSAGTSSNDKSSSASCCSCLLPLALCAVQKPPFRKQVLKSLQMQSIQTPMTFVLRKDLTRLLRIHSRVRSRIRCLQSRLLSRHLLGRRRRRPERLASNISAII